MLGNYHFSRLETSVEGACSTFFGMQVPGFDIFMQSSFNSRQCVAHLVVEDPTKRLLTADLQELMHLKI